MSLLTTELIFSAEAFSEEEEETERLDEGTVLFFFAAVVARRLLPTVEEAAVVLLDDVTVLRERETVAGLAFLAEAEERWWCSMAFVAFSSFNVA